MIPNNEATRTGGWWRGLPVISLLPALALVGCGAMSQETDIAGDDRAPATPSADAQQYERIPAGTQFQVQLQDRLGTEASDEGDEWTAVVTDDVTEGDQVLLQRGAVVHGEVTKAGPVEVEGETRQLLAVEPRSLEAGGDRQSIDAVVVEAVGEERRDLVTGENAAILGGGAVAGGLLGELLLDDALLGAVLGAAGGTAIAVSRSDTHVELPEGTLMTLELEQPVDPPGGAFTSFGD